MKRKFNLTVKEISKGIMTVEAESLEEAKAIAEEEYFQHASEYVLEPYETYFE